MHSIFRILGPSKRPLAQGVLIFILLALSSFSRVGQLVENSYLDLLYTWRAPQSSPQLLIVGIDEPSFQELGQPDPDGVVRHFQTQVRGRDSLAKAAVRAFSPGLQVPAGLTGLI